MCRVRLQAMPARWQRWTGIVDHKGKIGPKIRPYIGPYIGDVLGDIIRDISGTGGYFGYRRVFRVPEGIFWTFGT